MKTALITSDTYKNHNTGDGHPEKIDRVTAVIDNFKKLDNKNMFNGGESYKKDMETNDCAIKSCYYRNGNYGTNHSGAQSRA